MTIADNLNNRWQLGIMRLPPHMRDGMRAYIEQGRQVGGFLTLMIEGLHVAALEHADPVNKANMAAWREFFENDCPPDCHGSPEKMRAWKERGGLRGR